VQHVKNFSSIGSMSTDTGIMCSKIVGFFITSTSVFGDGHLSTHADPTRGQRAGQIGQRTFHTYDQAPIRIAHPHISDFGLP